MESYWTLATRLPSSRLSLLMDNCDRPLQLDSQQEAYQEAIKRCFTCKEDIVIVRMEVVNVLSHEEGKALAEEYRLSQDKRQAQPLPAPAPKKPATHAGHVCVPWGQFSLTHKQAQSLIAQGMIYQTGERDMGKLYHPHQHRTFSEVKLALEAIGIGVKKEGE